MRLFVGLGNPGKKYEKTRHNVGWLVLDSLATKISNFQIPISNQTPNNKFEFQKQFNAEVLKIGEVILAKPQTFMNDSGEAVSLLSTFYKIHPTDIYIIHDDLDIKVGEYKIQKGKGPKQHNGILSIEERLGRGDFWRVRVGIENRGSEKRIQGEVYTLQAIDESEMEQLNSVISRITN